MNYSVPQYVKLVNLENTEIFVLFYPMSLAANGSPCRLSLVAFRVHACNVPLACWVGQFPKRFLPQVLVVTACYPFPDVWHLC